MTTEQTTPSPAIPQDIPCITCGYNLRGLDPAQQCPECGAPIQRSVDARMKLIMSSPKIWARMVLAGLVTWLICTPYLLCTAMLIDYGNVARFVQWINYPGPKVWIVPMLFKPPIGQEMTPVDLAPIIVAFLGIGTIYLLTWPRHADTELEPPFTMRRAARWASIVLGGGMFMLSIVGPPMDAPISPILGTVAIAFTELSCTLLVYMALSTLARRLDLPVESSWIRRCGWIATFSMTASVVMLVTGYPVQLGLESYHYVLLWCYGAVTGSAAIIASGSLVRVALALWPLATGKLEKSVS